MESKYLMYFKTVQGNTVKTLFEVLKDIWHDINLEFDSTGMKILTIDGTHVALVYVKLKMESFEQYYCDETLIVGVNLSSLYKLIKTTTSHDTVVFYVSRDEPNKLGIELQNADENKKTCFKLKLLDIDHNECCIPELEFESVITIPSVYFQRICRDMLKLSETIKIKSNGTNLILSCSGDFADQETVIGETSAGMKMELKNMEVVEGCFSLKYLNLFVKASALCNTVVLYMKKGYPLILEYKLAESSIKFMIAPKQNSSSECGDELPNEIPDEDEF